MKLKRLSLLLTAILAVNILNVSNVNATEKVEQPQEIESASEIDLETEGEKPEISLTETQKEDVSKEKAVEDANITQKKRASRSTDNTDPNSASFIGLNNSYEGYITEPQQERWYFVEKLDNKKLTVNLNFMNSSGVDYDVYLYKLDLDTGDLNFVQGSETTSGIENIANINCSSGYYFIWVNGYQGSDTVNPYTLSVYNTSYDSYEINDQAYQATTLERNTSINAYIDNRFDNDFYKLAMPNNGDLYINFRANLSTATHRMEVYNGTTGQYMGYLPQGTNGYLSLNAGDYYFNVVSDDVSINNTEHYTLQTQFFGEEASRFTITRAGNSSAPIKDYVSGPYWRVYHGSRNVTGVAYDSSGNRLANADVEIRFLGYSSYGVTDADGVFSIDLVGLNVVENQKYLDFSGYMYSSYATYHYYTIEPIRFYSNGKSKSAGVSNFYHLYMQMPK